MQIRHNTLPSEHPQERETFPAHAEELFVATERNAKLRYEGYKKLSEM